MYETNRKQLQMGPLVWLVSQCFIFSCNPGLTTLYTTKTQIGGPLTSSHERRSACRSDSTCKHFNTIPHNSVYNCQLQMILSWLSLQLLLLHYDFWILNSFRVANLCNQLHKNILNSCNSKDSKHTFVFFPHSVNNTASLDLHYPLF